MKEIKRLQLLQYLLNFRATDKLSELLSNYQNTRKLSIL